jgi:Type I phosphodiesterase / nucleotide pyrophosphatase
VETVFESLDDAGVRTAGTTFLIYRGRHRHEVARETPVTGFLNRAFFRHGVWGPKELFYADIFASRSTGCRSQLGLPGVRDQHTGCVGAYLVEHDLFDFLLFSLPDNDSNSHRRGPHAQVSSLAFADRQLERLMHAAGGVDKFLDEHAVIVVADHSHSTVEALISLEGAFRDRRVLRPSDRRPEEAELAVCPGWRSAQIYVLDPERHEELAPEVAENALAIEGVDLVMRLAGDEGVISSPRGELRFAPGGDVRDPRGVAWSLEGDPVVVRGTLRDGILRTPAYPDALWRAWSALTCATTGDVLLSADPGWELLDWGGGGHVGKGTHGSMHRNDSESMLLWCGTGPDRADAREQWSIRDVTPMVLDHFGVSAG